MRFHKPIGTFLLLWPTLWALWIAAEGVPDRQILVVFIVGVVLMRAAGCVINDYADRDIDSQVHRTRDRPITSGKISPKEALVLFAVLCLFAFALVLTMNLLTIMMSFVALFLAASYPFMKRHTYLPQVYLGAAFGWAVPMVFAAQNEAVPKEAWLLFIATVLWATAYDTMYAMVDRVDDLRIGVKSTAILFGEADRAIIGFIQVLFFVVLFIVGKQLDMGMFYYGGMALAVLLAIYQQRLIRERDILLCLRAFLNNNSFGAVIFIGIVLHYAIPL